MSPVLGSIATRKSRAGPTAFLAADSNASCTAEVRTSRLMPFSFSQYSNTAKKSAFISIRQTERSHEGNKKVGKFDLPTLARWRNPAILYRYYKIIDFWGRGVKPQYSTSAVRRC